MILKSESIVSEELQHWIESQMGKRIPDLVVLPDYSARTQSQSCGDCIIIDAVIDEGGYLFIGARIEACSFCRASASWMLDRINRRALSEVINICNETLEIFKEGLAQDSAEPFCFFASCLDRLDCIRAPWEALQGALSIDCGWDAEAQDRVSTLACDACVSTKRIKWKTEEDQLGTDVSGHKGFSIIGSAIRMWNKAKELKADLFYRKLAAMQKFGKLYLTEDEKTELVRRLSNDDEQLAKMLKRRHLIPIAYSHLKSIGENLSVQCEVPSFKKEASQSLLEVKTRTLELKRIKERIQASEVEVVEIKGGRTKVLYDPQEYRPFSDFDFVGKDAISVMKVASVLMSDLGYCFSGTGDISFSMKIVRLKNGSECLTGHFHLTKKLNGIIVDADFIFPGMPLGLVDTHHFPEIADDGGVAWEEQFSITLMHLFKHAAAKIKDINDLYLILARSHPLDVQKLASCLDGYGLSFFTFLVLDFIAKEYDPNRNVDQLMRLVRPKTTLMDRWASRLLQRFGWPYSLEQHFRAQAFDLVKRCSEKFGVVKGFREAEVLMTGDKRDMNEMIEGDLSKALDLPLNTRLYLAPIVIFRYYMSIGEMNLIGLMPGTSVQHLEDQGLILLKYGILQLLLCPMGLFLPTRNWQSIATRNEMQEFVESTLKALGLEQADYIPAHH